MTFEEYDLSLCPRADELAAESLDHDRTAWLAARRRGLGGSDIAALLGLSKWKTPLALWREKMGLDQTDADSWVMKLGRHNEPLIAEEWARLNGATLYRLPFLTDIGHPHRCANVDYVAKFADGHVEIIEIKWSGRGVEDIPDYYYTQVVWYMAVTGIHSAQLVVADSFREPEGRRVDWNPEVAESLLTAADAWWLRYVEGNEAPEPTGSEERKDEAFTTLAALEPVVVAADSRAIEIVEKLNAAKGERDKADEAVRDLEADLAEHMAGLGAAKIDGGDWSASFVERAGSIRYAEFVKSLNVPAETLDGYRGPVSRFLTVRTKKGAK